MISIGCDHGGFDLKNSIIEHLKARGVEYTDLGCYTTESVDYPEIAVQVANDIIQKKSEKGILVCGTGIGMSIAANKIKGVRAAVCQDHYSVKYTRLHNDTNILCLGGRVIGPGVADELVDIFLDTEFMGGRHQRRIDQIAELENKF